jgi:hypothetical protein
MNKLIINCETGEHEEVELTAAEIAAHLQPTIKTPAKLREEAYQTDKRINWQSNLITVDEAKQQYLNYDSEGSTKADILKGLISTAKAEIRDLYPDAV